MKNAVITLFTIIALIQPGALLVRAHETNRMYDKINYGDANLDNVINISDATQIQKLIAKYNINSVLDIVDDKNLLDLDGNGTVNISDVTTLNRYYAKIITANCKIGETAYIRLNEEYVKATEITYPDSPVMHHLYVSNDYPSDEADFEEYKFNTMFDANEFITGNNEKNRYTIHVADGTYTDLQERYAGVDDSQRVASDYCGIVCKDYVYYEGNVQNPSRCVIEWDGKTGFFEDIVYNNVSKKSPFHLSKIKNNSMHTYIKGFTFKCTNLRYCFHIETGGSGRNVDWKISDCLFYWNGNPDCKDIAGKGSKPAIGAGHSPLEHGEFNNCVIHSATGVAYLAHDNNNGTAVSPVKGAEIFFRNCDFNNGKTICMSLRGNNIINEPYKLVYTDCVNIGAFQHSVAAPSTEPVWQVITQSQNNYD